MIDTPETSVELIDQVRIDQGLGGQIEIGGQVGNESEVVIESLEIIDEAMDSATTIENQIVVEPEVIVIALLETSNHDRTEDQVSTNDDVPHMITPLNTEAIDHITEVLQSPIRRSIRIEAMGIKSSQSLLTVAPLKRTATSPLKPTPAKSLKRVKSMPVIASNKTKRTVGRRRRRRRQ